MGPLPYRSRCCLCNKGTHYGLWCGRCLRPYIAAGERFRPSITVKRSVVAETAKLARALVESGARVVIAEAAI